MFKTLSVTVCNVQHVACNTICMLYCHCTSLLLRQALKRSTNISADDTSITTLLQAMLLIQNLNAPSSNASSSQKSVGSISLNPNSTIRTIPAVESSYVNKHLYHMLMF